MTRPQNFKSLSIIGTGTALPEKVLTNADLEKMVDTNDQWITERTGIKERRIAAEGTNTSTLAAEATPIQPSLVKPDAPPPIVERKSGNEPTHGMRASVARKPDIK